MNFSSMILIKLDNKNSAHSRSLNMFFKTHVPLEQESAQFESSVQIKAQNVIKKNNLF